MKNNKGFSLVELIVVIAIMAILAAVAIPTFAHFIGKANEASDADYYDGIEYAVNISLAGEAKEASAIAITVKNKKIDSLTYTVKGTSTPVEVIKNGSNVTVAATDANYEAVTAIQQIIDTKYQVKTTTDVTATDDIITVTFPQ